MFYMKAWKFSVMVMLHLPVSYCTLSISITHTFFTIPAAKVLADGYSVKKCENQGFLFQDTNVIRFSVHLRFGFKN